ncbi:hypothetical protein HK405_006927 [Cladochytrium tenue]|nr:hypothetical protein HK405_006927 [Cladochytrium tenue]
METQTTTGTTTADVAELDTVADAALTAGDRPRTPAAAAATFPAPAPPSASASSPLAPLLIPQPQLDTHGDGDDDHGHDAVARQPTATVVDPVTSSAALSPFLVSLRAYTSYASAPPDSYTAAVHVAVEIDSSTSGSNTAAPNGAAPVNSNNQLAPPMPLQDTADYDRSGESGAAGLTAAALSGYAIRRLPRTKLATLQLRYEAAPDYFEAVFPEALEGYLPNTEFHSRVTALNTALSRFRSLRDRTPIMRLLVLCVCGFLVIAFVTLRTAAVTVFLSDGLIVVAACGLVLTLVLVLSRRSTPETIVTEHVQNWNTADNQRRRLLWTSHREALPMAALHSISPPWSISVDLVHAPSSLPLSVLPARLRASASNGLFPPTPGLRDDGSDPYADVLPLYPLGAADADASDADGGPHLAAVAGDAVGAGQTPNSAEPPPPPPALVDSAPVLARDSPPPYHHHAAAPTPDHTSGLGLDVRGGGL